MATAALLPPLLPTSPRSKMLPILPTPPRSTMLPLLPTPCDGLAMLSESPSNPGRADSAKRWDANKKYKKPAGSPASSVGSNTPGRADSVERWDAEKNKPCSPTLSSGSSGSPGHAESVDRWDRNKMKNPCRDGGVSASLGEGGHQDGKNKRPISRGSSSERWDIQKKPRSEEIDQTTIKTATTEENVFAGSSFFASPEPSTAPIPTLLLRAH